MTMAVQAPPGTRLTNRLAEHPVIGTGELEKALVDLLDGPSLRSWREARAGDDAAVAELAAASCWHSNGFAKLVLHRDGRCALRLHVWPDDRPQTGDTEPHSHRWDFASTVLAGGLTIVEYAESEHGLPFVRCAYDGRDVRDEAPVRRDPATASQGGAGERYVTDRSVIHKVHPVPGGLVATLLVQGPHRSDTTAVYRIGEGLPPARPIDEDTVRELLLAVARRVR